MIKSIVFLLFLIYVSLYYQSIYSQITFPLGASYKTDTQLDSFWIHCIAYKESGRSLKVEFANSTFKVINSILTYKKGLIVDTIDIMSIRSKSTLKTYLKSFFLQQTEKIILRENLDSSYISDNPIITIVGYKNKKIFSYWSIIINPRITFNPKFIEFYHFLDSLVQNSDEVLEK